jgi:hypothetical protein
MREESRSKSRTGLHVRRLQGPIGRCTAGWSTRKRPSSSSGLPGSGAGIGAIHRSSTDRNQNQGAKTMTAQLFRTISTCVAALFVSTMLVTAATTMPTVI